MDYIPLLLTAAGLAIALALAALTVGAGLLSAVRWLLGVGRDPFDHDDEEGAQ